MVDYSSGILLARIMGEAEARAGTFPQIRPEHLWMGLTRLSELTETKVAASLKAGPAEQTRLNGEIRRLRRWFEERSMPPASMRRNLRGRLGRGPGLSGRLRRSPESVDRYEAAALLAEIEGSDAVDALHLARAILDVPPDPLVAVLATRSEAPPPPVSIPGPVPGPIPGPVPGPDPGSRPVAAPSPSDDLVRFGRDVTAQAIEGTLDPLIGRREELLRLAQVLSQKRKGNAILVGDAGVGKTCIVEGLARKIAAPDGPPAFRNKRIIEISMTALTAGTAHRGDLETRLQIILQRAEADPDLILFMDEIHMMMTQSGGLDPADIFKPALARGNLKMIGATTTREYDLHLARDEAVARRFEVIWVEEPNREEAIEIVTGVARGLETHHGVTIAPAAIEAAVDLSIRYLPERRLPDKALDLIDQACSRQVVDFLTGSGDPAAAAGPAPGGPGKEVDRTDIAAVLAARTRIPYEMLAATDRERIRTLADFLNRRIRGQESAMATVADTLRTAFQGLRDPRRPLASFLFAGPSGVGKTETAKALSEFLFGEADRLVRIDLSEYTERHQIARLVGAPPGYVGSDAPGMLTAAMRQGPASVVLFDEIEKGHPDVLNILLQILDEGFLTDGQGKKAVFREAVVVLTTNIMPFVEKRPAIGFGPGGGGEAESDREALMAALGQHLRPELLGRLGSIITLAPLTREALEAIADGVFDTLARRLRDQGVELPGHLRDQVRRSVAPGRFNAREIERRVEAMVGAWLDSRPAETAAGTTDCPPPQEEVLYSVVAETPQTEMALLVLDLVGSTRIVCDSGDTVFSGLIGDLFQQIRSHPTAARLLFLKCTGDGFFAAYQTVPDAGALALSFLKEGALSGGRFRIALHWGTVRIGPGGDPLGTEVHRVFRMESVQAGDRAREAPAGETLPEYGRILISQEALDRLDPADKGRFSPAGAFRLKGFDAPVDLWVAPAGE
jgi:ATP-dependent Clp protease ATP-binding subunit ClpC